MFPPTWLKVLLPATEPIKNNTSINVVPNHNSQQHRKNIMRRFIPFWTSGRSKRAWRARGASHRAVKSYSEENYSFNPTIYSQRNTVAAVENFMICFGLLFAFCQKYLWRIYLCGFLTAVLHI